MNIIREYLQKESLERLLARTKCTTRRHGEFPNLVLIKYDQIHSDMNDPLVQACRSIILDEDDDWRVICHPYDKFFNYSEFQAVEIDYDSAVAYEKLDGSIINMFYYKGKWRVSTSGCPDASGSVYDDPRTFAELFWDTWKELGYELPSDILSDYTFMFELMTPFNRIIIPHKESRIVLHGMRDKCNDKETSVRAINNWEVVKVYPFKHMGNLIGHVIDMKGTKQEGYVVCDAKFNRIKLKCPNYVALHHFRYLSTPKSFMELILTNEGSEFLVYFPEMADEYNSLKKEFNRTCAAIEIAYTVFKDIVPQKEFAIAIKDMPFKHILFAIRRGYIKTAGEGFRKSGAKKTIEYLITQRKVRNDKDTE